MQNLVIKGLALELVDAEFLRLKNARSQENKDNEKDESSGSPNQGRSSLQQDNKKQKKGRHMHVDKKVFITLCSFCLRKA